ncbi:hypothetical protein GINT2_000816 [Glugoides intestinalis]
MQNALFKIVKLYMKSETLQVFYVIKLLVNFYNSILKVHDALSLYKNEIFNDIQNICSPFVCFIVEKGCSYGCFDPFLEKQTIGIFKKVNKKLVYNRILTEKYLANDKLPIEFQYAIMSPYLNVESLEFNSYFYYNHNIKTLFTGKIKKLFFEMFNSLKESQAQRYNNQSVKFHVNNAKEYIYYKFELDGVGCMHSVEFFDKNEIIARLIDIKKQIFKWRNLTSNVLVDKTTMLLIKMLRETGVLLQDPDLELYPDFVKLVFPYKMLSLINDKKLKHQLMCIGVDLTNLEKSDLRFLFNLEKHNLKYFISFEIQGR